jgi:hypothetical protein
MVIVDRKANLLEVVLALRAAGRLARLLHGWKQESDQQGNHGNHDQQLNERKSTASFEGPHVRAFSEEMRMKKNEPETGSRNEGANGRARTK